MSSTIARKAVVWVAVVGLVAAGVAQLGAQAKLDVTGKWLMEVTTETGTTTPNVTLKQTGEKLAGHYSSETLGEADVTGTIKGQALEFSFAVDMGGQAINVVYTATVDSPSTMKGKISIPGLAEGTFSAKKQ